MREEGERMIFGIVFWGFILLILALFDPEMFCGIIGVSVMLFIGLRIIMVFL